MTRAIVVAFHKYTPFGGEFYEPILDFFLQQMKKYKDEFRQIVISLIVIGISIPSSLLIFNHPL